MKWTLGETAGSIPGLFEVAVSRARDRPAIAGAPALTYAELHARSAHVAGEVLDRLGARGRGAVAAVVLGHGAGQVTAVLAALRCGMGVVVINPGDPPARAAEICAELQPRLLLTDDEHAEYGRAASGFSAEQTVVCSGSPVAGTVSLRAPMPGPDDLAFLISTSGSSGRPKIVMQTHRNVLHNVLRYTNGLAVEPEDRIGWVASMSGGQGLATTWSALLNGATLCPFAIVERGVTGLGDWLNGERITIFDTVPSVLRNFARTLRGERFPGVRLVRLASEAGLRSDFAACRAHFGEDCVLASVLASSEAGIMSQALLRMSDEPPDGHLTVGRAADGIELLVLDDAGGPVPSGTTGQIVVRSRFLALGYWRDQALTAARFAGEDGGRRFNTGDLGRRSPAGLLTIVGRADSQVKIRGHRLQLEEVESALAAQPGVAAVAVAAHSTPRGDTRLTAYLAPARGAVLELGGLRRSLRLVLPAHAIPTTFVSVEALPMTPHGKVDRARLSEIESVAGGAAAMADGLSETEELILEQWRHAFEREEIDVGATFLDLGGDSLTAAVLAAGVHQEFGVELELGVFASEVTVLSMAELVERRILGAGDHDLPPLRPRRNPPASFAQRSIWLVAQHDPERLTMVGAYRVRGALDVDALRRSIDRLLGRHEILRTTFIERDGQLVQLIQPPPLDGLQFDDLRLQPDPQRRGAEILAAEAGRRFDLAAGPLLRWRLLQIGDGEHHLVRTSHHLITDALSWRIFFDELAVLYEAELDGRPPPLGARAELQYADYATWEWSRLTGERPPGHDDEVDWWERQLRDPPPPLRLPFERPAALRRDSPEPGLIEWGLGPDVSRALDGIGSRLGATFFMTRVATFAAMLALDGEQDDLLIELFVTARRRVELQSMIGLFINRALLRLRLPDRATFTGWLAEVRRVVLATSAHTTIPDRRRTAELHHRGIVTPGVEVKFGVSHDLPPVRFGGLEVEALPRPAVAPSRFTLNVDRHHEADRCRAEFDQRIHDPEAVSRFVTRLTELTSAVCADPEASLPVVHRSLRK